MEPPWFTTKEQEQFRLTKLISVALSAICSLFVVSLWALDRKKRAQVFVVSYGVVVMTGFIILSIAYSFGQKRLCSSNSVSVKPSDGLSVCMVEAMTFVYIPRFCAVCFAMQSWQAFRQLVLHSKAYTNKKRLVAILLTVPLLTVIAVALSGEFHADPFLGFCLMTTTKLTILIHVVPYILFTSMGLFFSAAVFVKVLLLMRAPMEHGGVSVKDGALMAGTSLKFLVFSGVYLVVLQSTFIILATLHSKFECAVEWGRCTLQYFDGTVDSYCADCGENMHTRFGVPFSVVCFLGVVVFGGFGLFFIVVNMEGIWGLSPVCGRCY